MIPAAIRERFALSPSHRLEWLIDGDGSIRVVPVVESPVQAFRGQERDLAQWRGSWQIGLSIETLNDDPSVLPRHISNPHLAG